jgi:DME family drug/metabolite transporter
MPVPEAGKRSSVTIGIFFAVMAGFCWGTFGIARALGPSNATSISASGFRLTIAAIGLIIWASVSGAFRQAGPVAKWPFPSMLVSGIGLGGFTYLYLESMYRAGVSIGAPVSCASIPICAMILEMIFYKKRPTGGQFLGMFVAIAGMTLATYAPDEQIEVGRRLSGVLFALLSGLVFAAYSLSFQANTAKFPRLMVQACVFSAAAVMMLTWAVTSTDISWIATPRGLASAAWLGLVSGLLGYWLYIRSMAHIPVSISTTLSMVEPLTGTILGIVILHESTDPLKMLGLLVLFFGIFLVGWATTKRDATAAQAA